jgi:AraC-like DNA-binding protein/quercetin dioxygenase-like cupin family protein
MIPEKFKKTSEIPVIESFKIIPSSTTFVMHAYYEIKPDEDREFCVFSLGFEKCNPDFKLKRHSYPRYVIEFVTKGTLILKIKNKSHILKPGTIGGFAPGIPHSYRVQGPEIMEHYYLTFIGNRAKTIFEQSMLASKGSVLLANYLDSLALVEKIYNKSTIERSSYSQELCCCYLKELLLEQVAQSEKTGKFSSQSLQTFKTCKEYIDNHFSEIISVSDIAHTCSIDSNYLTKLFKKHTRLTTNEYLKRLKLNKAGHLILKEPKMSIKQISCVMGFEDPYYFSRIFKKYYGLSPNNYKNEHLVE